MQVHCDVDIRTRRQDTRPALELSKVEGHPEAVDGHSVGSRGLDDAFGRVGCSADELVAD